MRGVVDDELEIVEQQNVYARGGGDPRAIWGSDKRGAEMGSKAEERRRPSANTTGISPA